MNDRLRDLPEPALDSTILSMLVNVAHDSPAIAQAQDRFVRYYGPPLTGYLVRSLSVPLDQASDVLHDFLISKLLVADERKNLARQYLLRRQEEPDLRFRPYLLRALKNFVVDRHRRERREPLALDALPGIEPQVDLDPGEWLEFDRDWAHNLIEQTLLRFQQECRTIPGKSDLWWLFERRVIRPLRSGSRRPRYDELVADLPHLTPKQASHRLRKAIARFRALLREMILGYLPAKESLDRPAFEQELNDLVRALAKPVGVGALDRFAEDSLSAIFANDGFAIGSETPSADEVWDEDEHGEIWNHLLTVPLDQLLAEWDSPLELRFSEVAMWQGAPLKVLPDLWRHPAPPLELLQTVRRFAKRSGKEERLDSGTELPKCINFVLYVTAIATAWLRHRTMTTRESNATCRQWARTALAFPWLDDTTRDCLSRWVKSLDESHP